MNDIRLISRASVAAVAFLVAVSTSAIGETVVIDDFTNDVLDSNWDYSVTLNQNGTSATTGGSNAVVSYDTTTNDDKLTWSFTGGNSNALQTALLRDDYSLANDGDMVQVSVTIPLFTGSQFNIIGGIALDGGSKDPDAGGAADNRSNFLVFLVRGDGQAGLTIGTTAFERITSVYTAGSEVVLRLQRESASTISAWYSVDGGSNFTQYIKDVSGDGTGIYSVTGFNALGVFAGQARSSAVGAVVFDDLTWIEAPLIPGDYNDDGKVDAADYVMWRDNPSGFGGDPDGYDEWKAHFGASNEGSSASQAAVPEPQTLLLGLLGTLLVARFWKAWR